MYGRGLPLPPCFLSSGGLRKSQWLSLGEAGCGAKWSRLMRVGEQLRFGITAKRSASAPPVLIRPLRGHLPPGEGMGASYSGVHANAVSACQQAGQAPPLRYDETWQQLRMYSPSPHPALRATFPSRGRLFKVRLNILYGSGCPRVFWRLRGCGRFRLPRRCRPVRDPSSGSYRRRWSSGTDDPSCRRSCARRCFRH